MNNLSEFFRKLFDLSKTHKDLFAQKRLTDEQLDFFVYYDKKFSYNSEIITAIISDYKLELSETEKHNLGSYVYYGRDGLRENKKQAKIKEMEAEGWNPLTAEVAKALDGKKIMLKASQEKDWFTAKVENIYKIFVSPQNQAVYVMKPRAKRYGTALASLEMPMYKII